jgi:hypothetical protein
MAQAVVICPCGDNCACFFDCYVYSYGIFRRIRNIFKDSVLLYHRYSFTPCHHFAFMGNEYTAKYPDFPCNHGFPAGRRCKYGGRIYYEYDFF